jgi:hypothetical protein
MMYKYVLTHQPNLVSLYALGRLHAPHQPLPPGEAADRRLSESISWGLSGAD